jgi:hypothetical protein
LGFSFPTFRGSSTTLAEIFHRHRNTLEEGSEAIEDYSNTDLLPVRNKSFSSPSKGGPLSTQSQVDLTTHERLSAALNRPKSHVLSTATHTPSSRASTAFNNAPPDFNYLRFALLCRSDNLEKVRALFAEMKVQTADVKLLCEVIKLYANGGEAMSFHLAYFLILCWTSIS